MESRATSFWRWSDTKRVSQMLLLGLAIGITVRWMNVAAPSLPVLASETGTVSTNAPTGIKIEGVSPSGPD